MIKKLKNMNNNIKMYKRFLIICFSAIFVILVGCESNDNSTNSVYIPKPINKKVLVEYFSNSSCIPCVDMHRSFIEPIVAAAGVTNNDTGVIFVSWQFKYPNSQDSVYWANAVQNGYRANYYQVQVAPYGLLDGNFMGSYSTSQWTSQVNNEFNGTKYLNITLSGTYDSTGRNGNITANIQTLVAPSTNDNVAHFILTEDSVMYISAQNGIKQLDNIMRLMISDTTGVSINLSGTQSLNESYNIQTKYNDSKCHIVVFVQSLSTKAVYGVEKIKVR